MKPNGRLWKTRQFFKWILGQQPQRKTLGRHTMDYFRVYRLVL